MRHVMVIGGGVIGLTSAWWLVEAGFRVTLLERESDVGSGASRRNGGQLSYRFVAPLADAGVPLKALRWLLQKDGPLRFKPEADGRQWRWLGRFLLNCSSARNRRTSASLLALGELSRQGMARLALTLPHDEFAWREPGKLVLYRSGKLFQAAAARLGPDAASQPLSPAAALDVEPALAALRRHLAGAIFTPGEAVADCHAFCQALAARLAAHPRFVGIVHGAARRLVAAKGRLIGVDSGAGLLQADDFVLAAGIHSRDLAASAGIHLPLYPLKGYSLSAPIRAQDCAPQVSVTDFERKVLYARIGQQLRVAAMLDMVGVDAGVDAGRIASLLRLARAAMPDAADYAQATPWAGLRPATPNGAPIVGATRYANLWLNVGHGALGFTFACGTASILAELMRGKEAPFGLGCLGLGKVPVISSA